MQWTDTKIEQLKELWKQNTLTHEIAKQLGTTKNSVIGKARRINLEQRRRGNSFGIRQPKQSLTISNRKPKEIPPSAIAEPENPTLLEDLLSNQCRFPLWDKPDEPSLCCGRNRHKHYSYCAYHVYISTKKVEGTKTLDLHDKP